LTGVGHIRPSESAAKTAVADEQSIQQRGTQGRPNTARRRRLTLIATVLGSAILLAAGAFLSALGISNAQARTDAAAGAAEPNKPDGPEEAA